MVSLRLHRLVLVLLVLGMTARAASAKDRVEAMPKELENVDVTEKLGATMPLDTPFADETGAPVTLGQILGESNTPVIVTFNYSDCPMLCSVQLGNLVDTMLQMKWNLGEEFRVVTIGLDPHEGHKKAMDTKLRYLARYERGKPDTGWRFLTGQESSIRAVADSVGFHYEYLASKKQYLHPAVLVLASSAGQVSTYVYGVSYDPTDLRDKLVVAGVGGTTEAVSKFILSCYHYDEPTGNGAVVAKIMRYGGAVFVFGLIALAIVFGYRRSHANVDRHAAGSHTDHV